MDLYELGGESEGHPAYNRMAASNGRRHFDFLQSVIEAAIAIDRPMLSQSIIRAINYHAISMLHHEAGTYRSFPVSAGTRLCPAPHRVQAMMDDFVNIVNRYWDAKTSVELAAYAVWRINFIHPFVNGNGRTARAVCYYILCVHSGGLLPGMITVPELLNTNNRQDYLDALNHAHAQHAQDEEYLEPMIDLVDGLLTQQLQSL